MWAGAANFRGLVAWARARGPVRGAVFLAHGEPPGLEGLKSRLTQPDDHLGHAFLLNR